MSLCNPHNPAGRAWTQEELGALNDVCERYGILVISDDIHCDIRLSDRPHIVLSCISDDAAEKSFICTAPTKTFNLAEVPSATISVANKKRRNELLVAMLFQARASEIAPRNARDLMFWPLLLVAESRHEAWLLSHRNEP
ncbi:MAG: aminotransferase class I/II-fold pyridoxal phosphate-dependent enzyme [Mesorhizobium sp.]|nr:aminotransferase class I/II-fold pyridoxal phosphate-dependent enzyme [Mesorhizobium sp.]TIS38286.1 MAG: aminotransferase class I/II-fold pyridoxal phosphate-dependent enzyme [Mesorhizobium sp.]